MTDDKPGNRRNALAKPPYKLAVNPNGRVVKVRLATNISNPVFFQDDGEWVMRSRAKKEGWLELSDVCTKAEQKKFEDYFKFDEQHNGAVRKLPDAFIPDALKRMRKAKAKTPEFEGFKGEYAKEDEKAKAVESAKASQPGAEGDSKGKEG